jgi:hypothetical protein
VWKVEIESLCLMLSARYARSLGGSEMHDAASNAPLEPVADAVWQTWLDRALARTDRE